MTSDWNELLRGKPGLSRFREAVRSDSKLGREARRVGIKFLKIFASSSRWQAVTQTKLCPKMKQPNVSRAIRRLVDLGYVERRRKLGEDHLCEYRAGALFRKHSAPKPTSMIERLVSEGSEE